MPKHKPFYPNEEQMPLVDEELAKFLPVRSGTDAAGLESLLVEDGEAREPIIVWAEANLVADGHRRFHFCRKHGIPFQILYRDFEDKDAVKAWMARNQLDGKRNLTDKERDYLIGSEYLAKKKSHGGHTPKKEDATLASSSQKTPEKTAKTIAEAENISERTVHNDALFADAVDRHEAKKPGTKEKILAGDFGSKREVIETAPILCKRCRDNGPARNCRFCAEEADAVAAKKKGSNNPRRESPVVVPINPDAEGVTSAEAGGGHPFLDLKEEVSRMSAKITRLIAQDGEDAYRLYYILTTCGLIDHDPKKDGKGTFILFKGLAKLLELAGAGGKMPSDTKIKNEWMIASGGKQPYIPPQTARTRAGKKR